MRGSCSFVMCVTFLYMPSVSLLWDVCSVIDWVCVACNGNGDV